MRVFASNLSQKCITRSREPRRTRYSGKAKCHTVETQVVMARLSSPGSSSSPKLVILHVLGGLPGSLHDHTLLHASGVLHQLPPGCTVRLDQAYEAVEAQHPQVRVARPKRARRNKPLNVLEQICNQVLSRLRMPIEHGLGHLKQWGVLAGLYRGRWQDHEDVMALICGLHNYKMLAQLHW